MAKCVYYSNNGKGITVNGVQKVQWNSYSELVRDLQNCDLGEVSDILFSMADRQNAVYDKLSEAKAQDKLKREFKKETGTMLDGGPDIESATDEMTTQQFIDSGHFKVDGERPVFQLSGEDYVTIVKKHMTDDGMSQDDADAWGNTVLGKWNQIADNARDFHRLILSDTSYGVSGWSALAENTVFDGLADKLLDTEGKIFRQVMLRNGKGKIEGARGARVIKNLNLECPLKGMDEKLVGHIDYIAVRDDGSVEIFNIKTSTEPYSRWPAVKKEKYKYQAALLKRMLSYYGVRPDRVKVSIIPVHLKYDDSFDAIEEMNVQPAVSLDTNDMVYTFQKYDSTAAQFVESHAKIETLDSEALDKVSDQLQKLFPGADIGAKGIRLSAKEWVSKNWRYCKPEPLPDGGYRLTMPDTDETVEVKDSRRGAGNEEFVQYVSNMLAESHEPYGGDQSAYHLKRAIKDSFKLGFLKDTGPNSVYIANIMSKYLRDRRPDTTDENGKTVYNYKWVIMDNPTFDDANILAFQNLDTGQVDVYALTATNPATRYSFKGRNNLLGNFIPDLNKQGFEMECTYGNMDAIRVMTLLNEMAPELGGDIKLGQLTVLGLSGFHTKKGVHYEFDSLMKQWDTIVKVAGKDTGLTNKFRENGIQSIAPEEVLRQLWTDVCNDTPETEAAELKALGDVIDSKTLVDGTVLDGLMSMRTVEGKIEKLEQLTDRLRVLMDQRGMRYKDAKQLLQDRYDPDPMKSALAKLYVSSVQALSLYCGDAPMFNEEFSKLQEYAMKPTSIANSSVRRVGYLVQKSIDNIRGEILDKYMPEIMPLFRQFYKDAGYTDIENKLVGSQARIYSNLFQKDEDGRNMFLFKNPYDNSSDLKPYERKFLKDILFKFYEVRCAMRHVPCDITGPEDGRLKTEMPKNYLYVPLQKAAGATRWSRPHRAIREMGRRIHRAITHPQEAFEEMQGFINNEAAADRDSAINDLRVYNPYNRSETSIIERDKMLSDRGEEYFETNIENIFLDFLSRQVQCDEFNKLLVRINGIELALTLKGIAEDDEAGVAHTVKAIDDFVSVNVYNKSIMEKMSRRIDLWTQPLRKLVSRLYIAAGPVNMMRDTIQGLLENTLMAVAKFQTDIGAKDVAYGYKEVFTDGVNDLMKMTKLNQFNVKYGFSNFDAAKVATRLKSGRNGILNADNWLYWTLRGPDYLNRMTLFVAKMHHDGVYDAYTLGADHRLRYDWRKDKRFDRLAKNDQSDMEKYNAQKSLYMSLIREFNLENPSKKLGYGDDLPDAYTLAQIRAIKTLGDSIYGAYDQSSKAKYENISIGRNFMFFSTWMNGIVDNYFKKRQTSQSELAAEQETDYNGNPLFFTADESGNVTTEDTGIPVIKHVPIMVQGIFRTVGDTFKELHNNGWNFREFKHGDVWSNPINRRNWRRLLTDLLVAGILTMLFKMWLTPKYREHKKEANGNDVVANALIEVMYKAGIHSFDTFNGPAAVLNYIGESTNPATYTVQKKVVSDIWNTVMGDKTFGETLMGSQAFFRSFQDTYKMYMRDVTPE